MAATPISNLLHWKLASRQAHRINPHANSAKEKTGLDLETIGELKVSSGRRGGFRIYSAPDGTEATVSYAHFGSSQEAESEIKHWIKGAGKIKNKTYQRDESGKAITARIAAERRASKSMPLEFLIIRRKGLICYFIQSPSLAIALRVEGLIE